jgi:SNF2 family DNA or RNA helicase
VCELEPAARRFYNRLLDDFMAEIPDEEETVTTDNALVHLLRLQQCSAGWIKDDEGDMQRISIAKQQLLDDVLEDLWGSHSRKGGDVGGERAPLEPLVIFGRFQSDLDVIREVAEGYGARCGELSGRVRESSPDYGLNSDAQMRPDLDVIAVQIQAGGVGIDLTRARYAIYYSMGYSLGDYEQSLKRVHRPGQDRPVTYIHLVARDTKDEAVYSALTERKNVVEAIIAAARHEKGE